MSINKVLAAAATLSLLGGCATTSQPAPLYDWGGYQTAIYTSLVKPGSTAPAQQIAEMEQHATLKKGKVPPGWYAHLAMLYAQNGETEKARAALISEREAFPESAVFVNNLLATLSGKPLGELKK